MSRRCCHRLDGPACLPGDRGEPSTTLSRLERAETHLRQDRAVFSGRRRIAEPTETSKHQTGRDRTPSPIERPTSMMSPSPSAASRGSSEPWIVRTTRHPSMCGLPRPPREPEVRPPRGTDVLQINLLQPFPMTVGCLAFGPDGRLSAVHDGNRRTRPRRRQSCERRSDANRQGDRTRRGPWAAAAPGFHPSPPQRGRCHATDTEAPAMPLDDYLRRETHREIE